MKEIYFIVVTFNGVRWLRECLESTHPYKTVVVDNASTDGTIEFIKKHFPDVIILPQESNLGFGRANNIGLKYAIEKNAKYVFLLNQDAKLNGASVVEKLVELHNQHPNYGILSPVHLNWEGTELDYGFSNLLIPEKCPSFVSDLFMKKEMKDIYEVTFVNAAAWFLPIETVKKVGGFDSIFFHYGEDVNFCQRVLFHKFKIGIVPSVNILHDTKNDERIVHELVPQNIIDRHFVNTTIIKYGNINNEEINSFDKFKKKLLLRGLYNLFTINLKGFKNDLHKHKLLCKLPLQESVIKNKREGLNHLI